MQKSLLFLILVVGVIFLIMEEFTGEQRYITKTVKLMLGDYATTKEKPSLKNLL